MTDYTVYNSDIALQARQFTGSYHWYKNLFGILYTDGIKWFAAKLNCYWLIDEIAIHSKKFQGKEAFMSLSFATKRQSEGVLRITDGNKHMLGTVSYDTTDLYVDHNNLESEEGIRFFLIFDGGFNRHVLLLPSEY